MQQLFLVCRTRPFLRKPLTIGSATWTKIQVADPFLNPSNKTEVQYLFGWLVIVGLFIETAHQIDEYYKDRKAFVKTYIAQSGLKAGTANLRVIFIILMCYLLLPILVFHRVDLVVSMILFVLTYDSFSYLSYVLFNMSIAKDLP